MSEANPLPIESRTYRHTNRAGKVYYLQTKANAKGVMRYSFAGKMTGAPVPCIPDGYEAREDPQSAQVTLRKIKPSAITTEEVVFVDQVVSAACPGMLYILDREVRSLVIYTSDLRAEERISLLGMIMRVPGEDMDSLRARMVGHARYSAMLKFSLVSEKPRLFYACRWCFRGRIDDWIGLNFEPALLAKLVEKLVPHLNKESFYDLI